MKGRGSKNIGAGKQLLAEEVFQHIGAMIVEGDLPAGHRIRDVEVAEELHVSRTPVREALQRLERIGLVTMYPSRYTEVTEITPEVVEQSLEFAGYQAGVIARMGVKRMTEEQREHAAGLVSSMIAAVDEPVATTNARWEVYSYLGAHAQNDMHRILVDESAMALFRNLRGWAVPPGKREQLLEIYDEFREAISEGDADEAERLARAMHFVD